MTQHDAAEDVAADVAVDEAAGLFDEHARHREHGANAAAVAESSD